MKHFIFISAILFSVITGEATAKEKEATTKEKEATTKEKGATTKEKGATAKQNEQTAKDKEMEAMVKEALAKGKEATAKEMEATAKEMEATTKKMEAMTKKMEAMAREQEQQEPLQPLLIPQVIQAADPLINKGLDKGPHKSLAVAPAVVAGCPASGQVAQGTSETLTVTFLGSLSNNKSVTIGGRTLTKNPPGGAIQAPTVASAFANGATTAPSRTTFSGTLAAGWTSGPAVGATVTFTHTTGGDVPDITVTDDDNQLTYTQTYVQGSAGTTLSSLFTNHTICVGTGANKQAQEEHISGGVLKDYKKGPGNPVDPEKVLGTWVLTNDTLGDPDATITYNYTAFAPPVSYTYKVYLVSGTLGANNSTYDFCNTSTGTVTVSGATLKTALGNVCP
jgi:hypothetical protein